MNKTRLSVNINKIATLRNARGKNIPDLIDMAEIILQTKAHGITVHPRPDERHIRYTDILNLKNLLDNYPEKEYNIEGYPGFEFLGLIKKTQPDQCTLVPDPPHVLTSNAGWNFKKNKDLLKTTVKELKAYPVRVSLFCDPLLMDETQWRILEEIQPDRVEIYTESYSEKWNTNQADGILSLYKNSVLKFKSMNIDVNAGHDLNQDNLFDLLKAIPQIREVSIGQALISEALKEGLNQVIKKYLNIIDKAFLETVGSKKHLINDTC